jgi:hypothetical protein
MPQASRAFRVHLREMVLDARERREYVLDVLLARIDISLDRGHQAGAFRLPLQASWSSLTRRSRNTGGCAQSDARRSGP